MPANTRTAARRLTAVGRLSILVATAATALLGSGCDAVRGAIDSVVESTSDSVASTSSSSHRVETTVVRVVDGDTVIVRPVEGSELTPSEDSSDEAIVRMLSIDAPELHPDGSSTPACGALEAAERLALLLTPGTPVQVVYDAHSDHTDRYGRSLAYIEILIAERDAFGDVNAFMVSSGHVAAWYPTGEPMPERFEAYQLLEEEAQAEGSGGWSVCENLGR